MKHVLDIAIKDIQQVLREKLSFLFLLIMPILFTVLFGLAFGRINRAPADTRVVVGFEDHDNSVVSRGLRGLLEHQTTIRLEELSEAGEAPAATVIVPAGYGQALEAGRPLKLEVTLDVDTLDGLAAWNAIQAGVGRTASAAAAARTAGEQGTRFIEAFEAACAAWLTPPTRLIVETAEGSEAGQGGGIFAFSHTAPAMMVQFALAGLLTAAQVLVRERKTYCMQRLLTTRAARHEILLGHFLSILLVIFVQFLLLVGFAQLVLGLNYLRLPLATLVMMLCTALFVAAVGLLIGALARTEDQAVIFSLAPMFVLSALGGAWLPLELTGEAFRAVGQVTPVALALDGFQNILTRGLAFNTVLLPAAALLGYALLCFALAVWKFRFE